MLAPVPYFVSRKPLLYFLLCIHLLRSINLLAHSQFWAEDGNVFYEEAYHQGVRTLFHTYAGYFHTIQRIVAVCTVYFPLLWAPFIFNGVAFLAQFLPVLLVLSPRTDWLFSGLPDKCLFAFLYLLCPINIDTFISLTNIQWYLPVWVLFYLLAEEADSRVKQWLEYLLLLLACLTGPFVLFILPIYGFLIYRKKTSFNPVHLGMLLIGFITQLSAVIHSLSQSQPSYNFIFLAKIFAVEIAWNSLLGVQGQKYLLEGTVGYSNALFVLTGFVLWVLTTLLAFRTGNLVLIIFSSFAILVALSGFYKGLHQLEKWGLNPAAAGRYANNAVLALIYSYYVLYQRGRQGQEKLLQLFGLLFGLSFFIAIPFDFNITRMIDLHWPEQVSRYEQAQPGEKVIIPINPSGWHLTLLKRIPADHQTKVVISAFEGKPPLVNGHVALWGNSELTSKPYRFKNGNYRLTIRGYSTSVGGIPAHVKVLLNKELLAEYFMNESAEGKHFPFELKQEESVVFTIIFDNDQASSVEDRNLFIKALEVTPL